MEKFDYKAMLEESERRNKEWTEKRLAKLREEMPDLVIEEGKYYLDNGLNLIYRIDNTKYLEVTYQWVRECKTALGWAIDFALRYDKGYRVIDGDYKLYVVTDANSCIGATVEEFFKDNGHKLKGKRRRRRVHTSTKGKYIELEGKRHYIESYELITE